MKQGESEFNKAENSVVKPDKRFIFTNNIYCQYNT